jgi:hypothetical protein
MTARLGPLLSLAWPWLAIGLVASLLVTQLGHALATREHPARHTLELRARGTRVVRQGPVRAVVRCDARLCEAEVSLDRPGTTLSRIHVAGTQGSWLAVLTHGSALWAVDEAVAPPYRVARRGPIFLAFLLSCVVLMALSRRWLYALWHWEQLAEYQPAVVVDGLVELPDGTRAVPVLPTRDGRTWARVLGDVPAVTYRERPFPRCAVEPDRDAKREEHDVARGRALAGLAALAAVWATAGLAWWG